MWLGLGATLRDDRPLVNTYLSNTRLSATDRAGCDRLLKRDFFLPARLPGLPPRRSRSLCCFLCGFDPLGWDTAQAANKSHLG